MKPLLKYLALAAIALISVLGIGSACFAMSAFAMGEATALIIVSLGLTAVIESRITKTWNLLKTGGLFLAFLACFALTAIKHKTDRAQEAGGSGTSALATTIDAKTSDGRHRITIPATMVIGGKHNPAYLLDAADEHHEIYVQIAEVEKQAINCHSEKEALDFLAEETAKTLTNGQNHDATFGLPLAIKEISGDKPAGEGKPMLHSLILMRCLEDKDHIRIVLAWSIEPNLRYTREHLQKIILSVRPSED